MFNRSAIRNMGILTYCQILIRQQQRDGSIPCVYCGIDLDRDPRGPGRYEGDPDDDQAFEEWRLTPEVRDNQRNVDHLNNDPEDIDADNLVACCSECNRTVGAHDSRGWKRLAERVQDLGLDPRELRPRVEEVRRDPLPGKDDPQVLAIAADWFGARIIQQRKAAAKRAGRPYNGPRTIDALRDEYDARGHDLADDDAEDAPF